MEEDQGSPLIKLNFAGVAAIALVLVVVAVSRLDVLRGTADINLAQLSNTNTSITSQPVTCATTNNVATNCSFEQTLSGLAANNATITRRTIPYYYPYQYAHGGSTTAEVAMKSGGPGFQGGFGTWNVIGSASTGLQPNTEYELSAWFASSNKNEVFSEMYVAVIINSTTVIKGNDVAASATANPKQWYQSKLKFTTPANGSTVAVYYGYAKGPNEYQGKYWVDDVLIRQTGPDLIVEDIHLNYRRNGLDKYITDASDGKVDGRIHLRANSGTYDIGYTVKNIGTTDVTPTSVCGATARCLFSVHSTSSLYNEGSKDSEVTLRMFGREFPIAAGQSLKQGYIRPDVLTKIGTSTLTVAIDTSNVINEGSVGETNNSATVQVIIGAPPQPYPDLIPIGVGNDENGQTIFFAKNIGGRIDVPTASYDGYPCLYWNTDNSGGYSCFDEREAELFPIETNEVLMFPQGDHLFDSGQNIYIGVDRWGWDLETEGWKKYGDAILESNTNNNYGIFTVTSSVTGFGF